jgi:hypothetical protein
LYKPTYKNFNKSNPCNKFSKGNLSEWFPIEELACLKEMMAGEEFRSKDNNWKISFNSSIRRMD